MLEDAPVLGLSWMKHHQELAVAAVDSGKISFMKFHPDAEDHQSALEQLSTVESFAGLSSVSINCSDDFLLASGFANDVVLYDVQSGKTLTTLQAAHSQFVNVSRFAHGSPHIFATASFDGSCKVWDLRQPLSALHPVQSLATQGLNVMVAFSPDDKYLLSSGVDTRITQWELPSFRQSPEFFPLRPAMHQDRYRRSMYLADSKRIVSTATDESHLHVISVHGKKLGVVDFRGLLPGENGVDTYMRSIDSPSVNSSMRDIVSRFRGPSCLASLAPHCPRILSKLMQRVENRVCGRRMRQAQALRSSACTSNRSYATNSLDLYDASLLGHPASRDPGNVIDGNVWIAEDYEDDATGGREYVQSIRTHPTFENQVGVLLSFKNTSFSQSYVVLLDLVPSSGSD